MPSQLTPWLVPTLGTGMVAPGRDLASRIPLAERRQTWVAIGLALLWPLSFVIGFKTMLAIQTALALLLAIVGLQAPMYGLIGIGILCSIDAMNRSFLITSGWFRYNTFNYLLLFVLILHLPLHVRQKDLHTWLIRLFLALLVVSLAWSPGLKNGILHILNLVTVFGLYVYFYRCRTQPRMWYLVALAVGLNTALNGFSFFFNRDGLSFVTVREEYLLNDIMDYNYIDPNALSYMLLTGLIGLAFGLASGTARRWEQGLLYLLFATNMCWVFLVGSRGGLMVASVCALFVLFSARSASRQFQLFAAGAIAMLLVVNAFPGLRDRTMHRFDKLMNRELSAAERTSSRSDFVIAAWRMFVKNPAGVGTGGFRTSWTKLDDTRGLSRSRLQYEKSSHSAWLKTIAENGLPGIVLFTALVGSFAFAGFRYGYLDAIAVGLMVTMVLALSFLSTQFQSKSLWFMVAGAIVFLHHRPVSQWIWQQRRRQGTIMHAGAVIDP